MIESVQFKNFKALRDTTLPLGPFTLIVGPNGSGKSTALQALLAAGLTGPLDLRTVMTVGVDRSSAEEVVLTIAWAPPHDGVRTIVLWTPDKTKGVIQHTTPRDRGLTAVEHRQFRRELQGVRVYGLDAKRIATPVQLRPDIALQPDGMNLAGVLDRLRDGAPERFEALNEELGRWLTEFDQILFDTPDTGHRAIALRMRSGGHKIASGELSQGTLLALAILTMSYAPSPPPFMGFEEPDRGIHPRLLRDVQDALYRLAYPENFGETRDPVQVVVTTHSPYFVDLFRDHPEEIVIAEKTGAEARFVPLCEHPNIDEILRDAHLGEAWYTGILGGVPSEA
jgi:predicted ATPase